MNTLNRGAVRLSRVLVLLLLSATTVSLTTFGETRVIDVLILGTTAGMVTLWLASQNRSIKLPISVVIPVLIIWILFLLGSIMTTVSISNSMLHAIAAIFISGTGIFIIPRIYSSSSFLFHILILSSVLGLLSILALVTPLESIGAAELLRPVPYEEFVLFGERKYDQVPVGGLGNPNALAITLVPGILAGVHYLRAQIIEHSVRGVVILGILTILPTITLVLTRSRGSFIALTAGLVMYAVAHYFSTDLVRALTICGIASSLLLIASSGTNHVPSLIESFSKPRAMLWRNAWNAILQQPLLGYGVGNSRTAISAGQIQPHNAYLMVGTWGGVGALVSYLYLFAQTLLLSVRNQARTIPAVFPAILTSYWTISVFESIDIFHLTIHSTILAITFGFVAHSLARNEMHETT